MSSNLIAVVGATGTGKSELALGIAEYINSVGRKAEIVNAELCSYTKAWTLEQPNFPWDNAGESLII